jgi:hypothetical protein
MEGVALLWLSDLQPNFVQLLVADMTNVFVRMLRILFTSSQKS